MLSPVNIIRRSAVDMNTATLVEQARMRGVGFIAVADDIGETHPLDFQDILAGLQVMRLAGDLIYSELLSTFGPTGLGPEKTWASSV